MNIPKYWSKGTAEGKSQQGKPVTFSCWRPSDVSEDEARESALSAARRILDSLLSGKDLDRYAYGCIPLREEVLNKMEDDQGNTIAVVTRNSFGSLVLNTEHVMFVDIDFPPVTTGEATRHFFAKLFGRAKAAPEAEREKNARSGVERFLTRYPQWGIRLYRTFAGLRGIVTHDLFDPKSDSALDILRELGSDPLYIRLCKVQECFRARLTPKPWRCGHRTKPPRYPFENDRALQQMEEWKAKYENRIVSYATCRFVGQLGNCETHPKVGQVVELHDFVTKCNEQSALA
jgi:hypothetical protein